MRRTVLIVLATVGLVAVLVIGLGQAGTDEAPASQRTPLTRAQVSKPIPSVPADLAALRKQVNRLDGGGKKAFEQQLEALRGRPVVVNLWASWCGPCRFELPFFQRAALANAKSIAFLGVNIGDNTGDAKRLAAKYPMPYPSFEDPRQRVPLDLGTRALPVTVFYDAKGERRQVHQGYFSSLEELAEAIKRYTTP